jgi:hypothetical protein
MRASKFTHARAGAPYCALLHSFDTQLARLWQDHRAMKTSSCLLIVASLIASSHVHGQGEPRPEPKDLGLMTKPDAAAKPDPFIKGKDKAEAKPKPTAKPAHGDPAAGIRFVFETYSMSLADFDALLTEAATSTAMWERVQQAVTENKATLDAVQSVVTKSGMRATIEATDNLMYATEFEDTASGVLAPSAWEMKPCGDRIEIDPSLEGGNDRLSVSLLIQAVRFIKWTEDKAVPPVICSTQPLFTEAKCSASVILPIEKTTFVGTLSGPSGTGFAESDTPDRVSLIFARPTLMKLVKSEPEPSNDQQLRFSFRTYRMDRPKAAELLRVHADNETLLKSVHALVKGGTAQLESLTTGTSRPGQRSFIEEVAEFIHGTETSISDDDAPVFSGSEMHPLGHRYEWEASIYTDAPDGFPQCDIILAPEVSEYRGPVGGHPLVEKFPEVPVFSARKIEATVGATLGHPAFIGTINQPRDTGVNGRKDDGKTCLQFVEVVAW